MPSRVLQGPCCTRHQSPSAFEVPQGLPRALGCDPWGFKAIWCSSNGPVCLSLLPRALPGPSDAHLDPPSPFGSTQGTLLCPLDISRGKSMVVWGGWLWGECVWPGQPRGCRCHPARREGGANLLPQPLYPPPRPPATMDLMTPPALPTASPPHSPRVSTATGGLENSSSLQHQLQVTMLLRATPSPLSPTSCRA